MKSFQNKIPADQFQIIFSLASSIENQSLGFQAVSLGPEHIRKDNYTLILAITRVSVGGLRI